MMKHYILYVAVLLYFYIPGRTMLVYTSTKGCVLLDLLSGSIMILGDHCYKCGPSLMEMPLRGV